MDIFQSAVEKCLVPAILQRRVFRRQNTLIFFLGFVLILADTPINLFSFLSNFLDGTGGQVSGLKGERDSDRPLSGVC